MTVYEVLNLTATYLGLEEELSEVFNSETATQQATRKYNTLLACLNAVYQRLATENLLLTTSENKTVSNGKINFSTLSKKFFALKQLVNLKTGKKIKPKIFSTYIEVGNGNYSVEYFYIPAEVSSFLSVLDLNMPISVVALGVAQEYCLAEGIFDDLSIFAEKFEQAFKKYLLTTNKLRRKQIVMPARAWER